MSTSVADLDFHEALYVHSLDYGRFDVLHKLVSVGAQVRPCVADRADLTPRGRELYDALGDQAARGNAAEPPMTVIRRPRRCQDVATEHRNATSAPERAASGLDPKKPSL
jgi:hypothetical protein